MKKDLYQESILLICIYDDDVMKKFNYTVLWWCLCEDGSVWGDKAYVMMKLYVTMQIHIVTNFFMYYDEM